MKKCAYKTNLHKSKGSKRKKILSYFEKISKKYWHFCINFRLSQIGQNRVTPPLVRKSQKTANPPDFFVGPIRLFEIGRLAKTKISKN